MDKKEGALPYEITTSLYGDHTAWSTSTAGFSGSYSIKKDPTIFSDDTIWADAISDYIAKEPEITYSTYHDSQTPPYKVVVNDEKNLSVNTILKTIDKVKKEIANSCPGIPIGQLDCYMTPRVKDNLLQAARRLAMYGKQKPVIACFDEYGRRLPDEVNLDLTKGMNIYVINPNDCGEWYLYFVANYELPF